MRTALLVALSSLSLGVACGSSSPGSEPAQSPSAPSPAVDTPAPPASGAGMCGGLQGLACPQGQYCFYSLEATCGAADQTGTCTPIAEMCTQEFKPVCGCNDKTYPNACYAAREGISVGRNGECPK